MTRDEFRKIALSFPEAVESAHMGHPDFRVGGKIFATLGYPDDQHGVVMLPVDVQRAYIRSNPAAFSPANGAWGARGSATVQLAAHETESARSVLETAWRQRAQKRLLKQRDA